MDAFTNALLAFINNYVFNEFVFWDNCFHFLLKQLTHTRRVFVDTLLE